MVDTLSITLAQLNQSVGDIPGNAAAMLAARDRAKAAGADLIAFPEMQLIGYPPEDLVLKPALIERAASELDAMALVTADGRGYAVPDRLDDQGAGLGRGDAAGRTRPPEP